MQLTRSGDYGIRGVMVLAQRPAGEFIPLETIAVADKLPLPFLAKVFQTLTRAGIVEARRGAGGGFRLAQPAREVTLLAIVEAIEGPLALYQCLRGRDTSSQQAICPVNVVWRRAQARLADVLRGITLEDLAEAALALRDQGDSSPQAG